MPSTSRHPLPAETPTRDPATISRRALLAVLLVLAMAWGLLFHLQLFSGRCFVAGDAVLYRPYADFSAARWAAHHQRTFWNPYVFLGLPAVSSLADPRPQWLPDALLSAWDALTRAPRGWPLGPTLLAHLLGMLCVAGLALRWWRCDAAPALLAGLIWGYAPGIVVPLAFGHDAQAIAVGLMPAVLLAADGVLTARGSRSALACALGLAAAVGLLGLSGHPQFVCYTAVGLVAFASIRWPDGPDPRRVPLLGAAAAMGAMMAAANWWPALLYLADTNRGDPTFAVRHAADFSLAPRDLVALAWPRAVGWAGADYWGGQRGTDYANSLGALGAAFAALGVLAGARGAERRRVLGLLAIAAGAIALALGPNLPWFGERLLRLPGLSAFRTPSTWMVLFQLAGALIAALGLDRALRASRAGSRHPDLGPTVALALLALMILARPAMERRWLDLADATHRPVPSASPDPIGDTRPLPPDAARRAVDDLFLHLALVGVAFGMATVSARAGVALALASTAALELCDLGSVVMPAVHAAGGGSPTVAMAPPGALALAARADPLHRAYPLDSGMLFSNDWIAWGARQIAGNATAPARWLDLRERGLLLEAGVMRAIAAAYFGGDEFGLADSAAYDSIAPGVVVRRDALPRAHAVARVESFADDAAVLDALAGQGFDPARIAYTTDPDDAGDYPGSVTATVKWRRDDPDALEWVVSASAPAYLVVADNWFRGWSATLDGAVVPITRVDHVLRGLRVPAGRHDIAMRYVPPGWPPGRAVSLLAWGAWIAAALALGSGNRWVTAAGARGRGPQATAPRSPARRS